MSPGIPNGSWQLDRKRGLVRVKERYSKTRYSSPLFLSKDIYYKLKVALTTSFIGRIVSWYSNGSWQLDRKRGLVRVKERYSKIRYSSPLFLSKDIYYKLKKHVVSH
ncbi:hypothetical protein FF125_02460 [Aureibaculum algae]|uniref:Uncharacterized protein n=1 Tax=Aureibaculum algae TaxID=2584122 RepID=A0A5B7TRX2_9FLAO|nr:hypothetical protein [Aureibaculum algae]QCX37352.1 hypothetical protein FF125_02460 [Aureibaculum algae]